MPSLGYYNASKFVVEGLSGALVKEVEPLGINVMVVEPSGFRTDWAGRSADESKEQISDYSATAGAARTHLRAISGKQAGDPARAATAIIDAVETGYPPHHLLLGNDAFDGANAKLKELTQEFSIWEKVSRGADFPSDQIGPKKKAAGDQEDLGQHTPGNEEFIQQAEADARRVFGRFAKHIMSLEIHFSDKNGTKPRNHDKRCVIEARSLGRPPVVVSDESATTARCFYGATKKMQRLLESSLGKVERRLGRETIRHKNAIEQNEISTECL